MTTAIALSGELRQEQGKRASRRLRTQDKVPGTLYGAQKETLSMVFDHNKLSKAMEKEAFYSSILTLSLNGQTEKVVIKAIQRHPYKPRVTHIDLFRINPKEKLIMQIPLHFLNEQTSPAVKAGGVVSHFMNEVPIRCLPADLPEYIEVDLASINMNEYVHLSDLKLPSDVELAPQFQGEEHNRPVVHAHMPHIIEEPVEAAAPVSPEVEAIKVSAGTEEAAGKEGKEGKEKESKGKDKESK